MSCHLIVLLICRFKAGASGAATSVEQLQAYAGGGSGLTKGEHGNHAGLKSTPGFSLGIEVGTETTGPGIAFPAGSLLAFLNGQESKCLRGTSGRRKNKSPSATDSTLKPTFSCIGPPPAATGRPMGRNHPRPKAGLQRETAARSPSGYIIPLKNITLGDFFIYYGQFRYTVCE